METARAALADAGNNPPLALKEFARIRKDDAEEACHSLFHKYKLTVDVPIVQLRIEHKKLARLPVVRFSSWMQYLMDNGSLERLTGVEDAQMEGRLGEFWLRYQQMYPEHQVFTLAERGTLNLSRCVPVWAHIDEGRTYKSKALLVLSAHGCVGRGTRNYARRLVRQPDLRRDPMGMNYTGCTWSTNFIYGSLHRTCMTQAPESLPRLLADFAADMTRLATDGVWDSAGRAKMWVQVLGVKGDLPALGKIGNFVRNYSRVPKRATSLSKCVGICFMCHAGKEDPVHVPFEDFTSSAAWKHTIYLDKPWQDEPPILGGIPLRPDAPEAFFVTDLWHNWHNGCAKVFFANAAAMFVYTAGLIPARSIEAKLAWLSADFLSFCTRCRISPYMTEFTRDNLSLESQASYPQGLWHKGEVSTQVMLYLQNFCERVVANVSDDPLMLAIAAHA